MNHGSSLNDRDSWTQKIMRQKNPRIQSFWFLISCKASFLCPSSSEAWAKMTKHQAQAYPRSSCQGGKLGAQHSPSGGSSQKPPPGRNAQASTQGAQCKLKAQSWVPKGSLLKRCKLSRESSPLKLCKLNSQGCSLKVRKLRSARSRLRLWKLSC